MQTFDQYDLETGRTDRSSQLPSGLPPCVYYALKLNGEAGEVAEKIGKIYRDRGGVFTEIDRLEITKELGDCLWYISRLAVWLGYGLAGVAALNIKKLADRAARGVLGGSGDNR